MVRIGEYLKTGDGLHWICIESAIDIYSQQIGDPNAEALVRFFKAALAIAQEHS